MLDRIQTVFNFLWLLYDAKAGNMVKAPIYRQSRTDCPVGVKAFKGWV